MAVDIVRSCYRTDMRFNDAGTVVCPVRWFFCHKGALRLPFHTRFASGNWASDKIRPWKGVGEVKGVPRVYDKGKNTSLKKGKHFCGTKALFEEGLDADPTWVRPDGCCPNFGLPPFEFELLWHVLDPTEDVEVIYMQGVHFMTPALQDAGNLLVGRAGSWNALFRIHLYVSATNVGPDMVPADFTDLSVSGYVPIALGGLVESTFAFNALGYSADGLVDTTFHLDSATGGELVLGAWIERTSDESVCWQGEYLNPIELPMGPFDIPTEPQFILQSVSDT